MRWINSCVRAASVAFVLLWASPSFAQASARSLFQGAQSAEKRLQSSQQRLKKKSEWVHVAKQYRKVVLTHPQSGYCDDALYYEGEIHLEIYRRFKDASHRTRALDTYLLLANGYPASKWAKRARLNRGKLYLEAPKNLKQASIELRKITSKWPNSAEGAEARRLLDNMNRPRRASAQKLPPGIGQIRNIRHWTGSKQEYTRVVIDLDRAVKYRQGQLENPDRIYFDLIGTRVTDALATRTFKLEGDFLRQIRVGQNKPDVVRVVLDFKSISAYNVFTLPDPYRLVVDIRGSTPTSNPPIVAEDKTAPPSTPTPTPESKARAEANLKVPPAPRKDGFSLAQQLGLVARRVVIDPGHGGRDPGTSSKTGLREKDMVLDISRRVVKLLEKEDFEVLMTRTTDVFIPLEERTAIANSKGADLFVSIHVNSSPSTKARGLETYYLNLATTPDAERVAARENASTMKRLSELQGLLQKVMNNSKISESRELASHVQGSLASGLLGAKKDKRNRGVKTAPFYVLLGAQMPAVLVEVGFISNKSDQKLLSASDYRQKIAQSIANGIRNYHETLYKTTKVAIPADGVAQ